MRAVFYLDPMDEGYSVQSTFSCSRDKFDLTDLAQVAVIKALKWEVPDEVKLLIKELQPLEVYSYLLFFWKCGHNICRLSSTCIPLLENIG